MENPFGDHLTRRKLRRDQRELHDTLIENRDKMGEVGSFIFSDLREKNNALFQKAKHPREQFNDALNLREIAKAATSQVQNLDDMSRRFDFETWADAIKHKYENDEDHIFSWNDFGKDVGSLFLRAPRVCPMLGVMRNEVKQRVQGIRGPRQEKGPEVRPEMQEEDGEAGEATNTRISRLLGYLDDEQERLTQTQTQTQGRGRAREEKAPTIGILSVLIDPADRVQTVENFFDYAFLIKDKHVVESLDEDGLPVTVRVQIDAEEAVLALPGQRQMVLSLNIKDLTELAEWLPRGHACPLHRDDALYAASDAREQADILARRCDEENRSRKKRPATAVTSSSSSSSSSAVPSTSTSASTTSSSASASGSRKSKKIRETQPDEDEDAEEEEENIHVNVASHKKRSKRS